MSSSKGPIRVPDAMPESLRRAHEPTGPEEILLPDAKVIGAGVAKFREMVKLHWPQRGAAGSISFNPDNLQQLATVLGLVYLAMCEADRIGPWDPTR